MPNYGFGTVFPTQTSSVFPTKTRYGQLSTPRWVSSKNTKGHTHMNNPVWDYSN